MPSKEVTPTEVILSADARADMQSFDDAIQTLSQSGIEVHNVEDFGDGFMPVEKATLIDVPFIIVDVNQYEGDQGQFTVIHAMTKDNRKVIFTDGGKGIHKSVTDLMEDGKSLVGSYCKGGLTASHYEYVDNDGNKRPATTYYIQGL